MRQQNPDSEPALPSNDYEQPIAKPSNASSPDEFVNPALMPDKSGHIKTEIVDLMYAAQEAFTRKDFEGKDVELIGQLVLAKAKTGAESGRGGFVETPPTGHGLLRRGRDAGRGMNRR